MFDHPHIECWVHSYIRPSTVRLMKYKRNNVPIVSYILMFWYYLIEFIVCIYLEFQQMCVLVRIHRNCQHWINYYWTWSKYIQRFTVLNWFWVTAKMFTIVLIIFSLYSFTLYANFSYRKTWIESKHKHTPENTHTGRPFGLCCHFTQWQHKYIWLMLS